jgi:hypothetical protein
LVFPSDPVGLYAQRHEEIYRDARDLGLAQDGVAQTATAARKHHARLRVRYRKRRSRCQSFSSFIKLWLSATRIPDGKGYKFTAENVALLLQAAMKDVSPKA